VSLITEKTSQYEAREGEIKLFHPDYRGLVYGPGETEGSSEHVIKFGERGGFEPGVWIGPADHPLLPELLEAHPGIKVVRDDDVGEVYVCWQCPQPTKFGSLMQIQNHNAKVHTSQVVKQPVDANPLVGTPGHNPVLPPGQPVVTTRPDGTVIIDGKPYRAVPEPLALPEIQSISSEEAAARAARIEEATQGEPLPETPLGEGGEALAGPVPELEDVLDDLPSTTAAAVGGETVRSARRPRR
jgi:hypothetical protein